MSASKRPGLSSEIVQMQADVLHVLRQIRAAEPAIAQELSDSIGPIESWNSETLRRVNETASRIQREGAART